MKKYIFLYIALLLAPCTMSKAQNYIVSSLATPGAATFSSEMIKDGVITLPFTASTQSIEIETNQDATVTSDANWCRASYSGKTLTLTTDLNSSEDARTATLTVRSKDFHPLLITVKQEARLAFAVISDTHVGNNWGAGYKVKIPQALRHLTARGKLDAMAVVGDLTDNGRADQYKEFVEFFGSDENIVNPVDQFLFMMGNHDNFDGNGQANYKNGLKAFCRPKPSYPLHQYVLIKGYPFITISDLGSANNDITNPGNGTNSYPTASVRTLESYLRKAAEEAPGKPIFVFTHVPPRWTCYSTWVEFESEAWAMKVLNPVLNKYPQAVVFGGHSHYPLGDPRSIHQGANPNSTRNNYYTAINTASTTYSEINPGAVDAGIHPEGYAYVTEGMILVEQDNGDIEIRRYDTYRDVEIDPEHRWVLKAPFDGSMFQYADIRDADDNPNNITLRTGLPAPAFAEGDQLKLEAYPGDVKVTFPQATDNECVFRYKVRLLKGTSEVKSSFVFSQFYLTTDMPKKLSHSFTGLKEGEEYSVEVIAYDSYDNQSAPLSATFTAPSDTDPVPEAVGCWTFDNPDDLLAGTGIASLQAATHSKGIVNVRSKLKDAGIYAVEGPAEGNGAISVPVNSSLLMNTNINTESLSSYTLLMDIRSEQLSGYTALYQNDLTNTKDGSFFIKNGSLGLNSNGLGYGGILASGKWHRVLFVARDNAVTIYLDGHKVAQSISANADIWQMSTGALFFADNDGEEHVIETSEIRFWDVALTKGQASQLGSPIDEGGSEEVTVPEALGAWTFDNADDLLAGTGSATLQSTRHSKGSVTACSPSQAGITPVEGPAEGNGAVTVPKNSSLLLTTNLNATSLDTYTILWDVRANDYSPFIPLLQNDLNDNKDGSLFISKNMVGLNSGNLGYHGSLTNGSWYRIVFVVKSNIATVYVDGEKVGASTEAIPKHWLLTTGALFFADEDGEEETIETAEIRFWNEALGDEQIQKLGAIPAQ